MPTHTLDLFVCLKKNEVVKLKIPSFLYALKNSYMHELPHLKKLFVCI